GMKLEVVPHPSHVEGKYSQADGGEFLLTNVKLRVRREGSTQVRDVPLARAVADVNGKGRDSNYGKISGTLDDDPRTGWTTRTHPADKNYRAVFELAEPLLLADGEVLDIVLMHRSLDARSQIGRTLGLLTRDLVQAAQLARQSRAWKSPSDQLQTLWRETCDEIGVLSSRLRIASRMESPFLTPGLRKTLVLPSTLANSDDVQILRHVLRHEAAHLKHHDASWIPGCRILSYLVWFHPLAWWISSLHLKACEEACDAAAARLSDSDSYRSALAQLALELVPPKMAAAAFLRVPKVINRVRAVSHHVHLDPPRRWSGLVIAATLALFGGALGSIGFADDQKKEEEPAAAESPLLKKMESITIPELELVDTRLEEALQFLQLKSVELDPEKKGVNIINAGANADVRISLRLSNVPLSVALRYVTELAQANWRVDEHAIAVIPAKRGNMAVEAKPAGKFEEKLQNIVIPSVEFVDTPLSDALQFLVKMSAELDDDPDPAQRGINLILRDSDAANKALTLKLSNVPVGEALRYTAQLSKLKMTIEKHSVVLSGEVEEANRDDGNLLFTEVYRVPPELGRAMKDLGAKAMLKEDGILFPEGCSAIYNPTTQQLIVRNTKDNHQLIQAWIRNKKAP
ncbi:MAG: M56 family metallopeptidase, partial [Verrucomicrobiota bacterium]